MNTTFSERVKQLIKKISTKAVSIFNQGGIPLTSSSNEEILQGGLFAAIDSFVKESSCVVYV